MITEQDFKDPVYFVVGYLNRQPHKKQLEVLRSKAKYKVICCGRRAGKTEMVAWEIIRGAVLNIYPKQIAIAPTYKQSEIIFNKVLEILRENNLMDDLAHYPKSPRPKIIWTNRAYCDFGSTDNPDSMRGEAYDRVFNDEASFIKDTAWSAIRPLGFDTGAPVWYTSTPWGKVHFYDLFQRGERGVKGYESFHFTSFDNPYIDHNEIKQEVEEYGEKSIYIQTEIYGNFVKEVDMYFPRELIESCIEEYPMINYV